MKKSSFKISEETRNRCKILPADEDLLKKLKVISTEYFSYLAEYPDKVSFSLYFVFANEVIEFIRPGEYSKELLETLVRAHDRSLESSKICILRNELENFMRFIARVRNKKLDALRQQINDLDERAIAVYETLSGASQLVVKGGINGQAASQIEKAAAAIISTQLSTESCLSTLSNVILCDPTLYDHSASVAMFSCMIAKEISRLQEGNAKLRHIPAPEPRIAALGGLYHDVGKTCVPNAILNKPGKLTEDEFEIMKTHTTLGHQELLMAKLDGVDLEDDVIRVALEHHERFQGGGYPFGRKGRLEDDAENGIALHTRIVSIADVYSALLMKRVYKEAYQPDRAIDILRSIADSHFDPDIFAVFEESLFQITTDGKEAQKQQLAESAKGNGKIIQVG